MRVLLGVSAATDAGATSEYVGARFDTAAVEVDVLTTLPPANDGAKTDAEDARPAERVAAQIAERLESRYGVRRVRLHVRRGDPTETIVAASERWRSALVLIGAPRRRGLLTAFGMDSVARGVSARAHSPVELVRATSLSPEAGNRVLAVLDIDEIDDFPFEQLALQSLSWRSGGLLRIIAVQPEAVDTRRADANPAAVLRSLRDGDEARTWAAARLEAVCRALAERAGGKLSIDHRRVEGHMRDVALDAVDRLSASLLVLGSGATDRALRGLLSRVSPAAITMAAPCSVLLLRADARARAHTERPSHLAPLSHN